MKQTICTPTSRWSVEPSALCGRSFVDVTLKHASGAVLGITLSAAEAGLIAQALDMAAEECAHALPAGVTADEKMAAAAAAGAPLELSGRPARDGELQAVHDPSPSVWSDPAAAGRHAEKRRVELVQALASSNAGRAIEGECFGDLPGDAVKGVQQGVCIDLIHGHGGAPGVARQSTGAAAGAPA